MGKIVISTNVSLDGVVQDPDGKEGFRAGRLVRPSPGARTSKSGPRSSSTRRCAPRRCCWAGGATSGSRPGGGSRPGEWAARLNGLPKYVVSSTLDHPRWSNATVLKGDVLDEVSRLKQELDGDIVVYASYQLGRMLIENDLVDELRLFVFPVVVGAGERLFGVTGGQKPLRLIGARPSARASSCSPTNLSGPPDHP